MVNLTGVGLNSTFNNCSYAPTIYVSCNSNRPKENATPEILNRNPCQYSILLSVADGCPVFDVNKIVARVESVFMRLRYFMSVLLILAGFAIGIFGKSMWDKIVFLILAITFTGVFLV